MIKSFLIEGGDGSGNFGHQGRPGEVGGSTSALSSEEFQILSSETSIFISKKAGKALKLYCGAYFQVINRTLRNAPYSGSDFQYLEELESHKGLHLKLDVINPMIAAFKDAPELEKDIFVYRGHTGLSKNLPNLKEGDIFEDSGFISTSAAFRADDFVPSKDWHFRIRIPKGTQVLALGKISHLENEKEILLKPGTKFKVVKVYKSTFPTGLYTEHEDLNRREHVVYELDVIS